MNNHDEETEEEHAVRLRKISEEVKSDIKTGRYKYGQIHPNIHGTITGRFDYDSEIYQPVSDRADFRKAAQELVNADLNTLESHLIDVLSYGSSFISHRYDPIPRMIIYDECHYIRPEEYWIGNPTPKEKDWDRKSFKSGGSTAPTDEVRAKLRAKRKAKKK